MTSVGENNAAKGCTLHGVARQGSLRSWTRGRGGEPCGCRGKKHSREPEQQCKGPEACLAQTLRGAPYLTEEADVYQEQ